MKILGELIVVFLRIGMFTFGGGYAMLPLLQAELVEKRKWITEEQLMDYYCIGQSTPGIIAVNVATFIGYNKARVLGAICSTLALITVPVIIILLLANVLSLYMENQYVMKAFVGIRIVVTALIIESVWRLWKVSIKRKLDIFIFVGAVSILLLGLSPVCIVLIFASVGLILAYKGRR